MKPSTTKDAADEHTKKCGGCTKNASCSSKFRFPRPPRDEFLYVFLRFNSLSKVELCQTMFYIIIKDVKSWTIHYLTSTQLHEYFEVYRDCPVKSFNTGEISFATLPLHRYYISDFVELCHRGRFFWGGGVVLGTGLARPRFFGSCGFGWGSWTSRLRICLSSAAMSLVDAIGILWMCYLY